LKIRDVMRRDFLSVTPEASLMEVARAIVFADGTAAAVVDEDGALAGIIAETDLLPETITAHGSRRALRLLRESVFLPDPSWIEWASGLRARDVMRAAPVAIHVDDDPQEVGRGMLDSDTMHMPVLNDSTIVGILARGELLRLLRSRDLTLQRSVERLLWRCGFFPPQFTIDVEIDDGTVLLEGEVADENDARVVGSLVAALDGVSDVRNLLTTKQQRARVYA
jgi:CBS domain-containing protein